VCIDFGEMDKVLDVHEDDLDVVLQPGVGWVELNRELEAKGLFFPVDPAPGAKVGGMVSSLSCMMHHIGVLFVLSVYDLLEVVGMIERECRVADVNFSDRNVLLRHQRLPLWHNERLGRIPHARPG
jgi:hypothetical protein